MKSAECIAHLAGETVCCNPSSACAFHKPGGQSDRAGVYHQIIEDRNVVPSATACVGRSMIVVAVTLRKPFRISIIARMIFIID